MVSQNIPPKERAEMTAKYDFHGSAYLSYGPRREVDHFCEHFF
ncbi:hypothetical protein IMCC12053_1001 [Celeribacter marinus]|uniref:Uncharacterized protein n=1 Tax=Celeribacter marinus TaxID=1397108 RepID=A0A0N7HID9_9RHOB|nr:hypothetical protein IMCC12053_1001 [Celeribacter marinus]